MTKDEVDELISATRNPSVMIPAVRDVMATVQKWRRDYVASHKAVFDEKAASSYLTDWMANFEIG